MSPHHTELHTEHTQGTLAATNCASSSILSTAPEPDLSFRAPA
eukprot:CAMPEP_0172161184 /NCGR_PEP_ID=MMETSP1050-20130122/5981_1 /TAXON_ID=233186 /ORGANISM="Cryptomonas curvata, Strain CCAP979/52" /LENGTH=42 /DNA_ID= /DNA_START= /DNA_END= /DNA_ORIENTATION=